MEQKTQSYKRARMSKSETYLAAKKSLVRMNVHILSDPLIPRIIILDHLDDELIIDNKTPLMAPADLFSERLLRRKLGTHVHPGCPVAVAVGGWRLEPLSHLKS